MNSLARPTVSVFAVEDRTVQLTWRHLGSGTLRLRVRVADRAGSTGRWSGGGGRVIDERAVVTNELPGSLVIDGLPAGTTLSIEATLPGSGEEQHRLEATTLASLPGPELCRIATVSDLHLGTHVFGQQGTISEHPTPAVAHPERCARSAIADTATWGAEHLVAKGDLTNHGQVPEWRQYRRLVDEAPFAVDALPGNHDRAFDDGSAGLAPEEAAKVFDLSMAAPVLVRDLPGVRLVLFDSTSGGRHIGRVDTYREQILDAVAESDHDRAVLVMLHHQLQPNLISEGWPIGVPQRQSARFLEALAGAHRRVFVTSGHTHRHRRWSHAGVTTTQVGSTKDYPGVWAGYAVHEGGLRQVVRRVSRPDCLRWTDHTRRAAFGTWRLAAPGRLPWRCFDLVWP